MDVKVPIFWKYFNFLMPDFLTYKTIVQTLEAIGFLFQSRVLMGTVQAMSETGPQPSS